MEDETLEKTPWTNAEILNDFTIGSGTNASVMENETLEQQKNGHQNNFGRFCDSSSHNQVKENYIDDNIRRAINKVILTVEKCVHHANLTAMDNVLIPRAERAVRSITGSSCCGPNSEVQNRDQEDVLGKIGNTSVKLVSSRLDLKTNPDRNEKNRNEKKIEDGNFPASIPN